MSGPRLRAGPARAVLVKHVKAEDQHVGIASERRHALEVVRVELVVVVQVGDDLTPGMAQARISRGDQAPIFGEPDNAETRIAHRPGLENLIGSVRRAVVDRHPFPATE